MIELLRRLLGHPAIPSRADEFLEAAAPPDGLLADLPSLVLDTETTGLDVSRDRIVQIGAVAMRGAEFENAAALDRLVDPGCPIPARAVAIHGIDEAMLAGAPRFSGVCNEIETIAAGRVWIGHNIGFDIALVAREMALLGRKWRRPQSLCTTQLFAALYPRERDLNLESLTAHYGLSDAGRHSALGDAQMTAALWRCILGDLAERGLVRLADAAALAASARAVVRHQRAAGW